VPAALAGAWVVFGGLRFQYAYLEEVARGSNVSLRETLFGVVTATAAGLVPLVTSMWLVSRFPVTRTTWLSRLPLYLATLGVAALVHICCIYALRMLSVSRSGLAPTTTASGASSISWSSRATRRCGWSSPSSAGCPMSGATSAAAG
jgi:hypothetical protein